MGYIMSFLEETMEVFGALLSAVGYGLGAWVAMMIVFACFKARRTRVSLQNIRDFMSRGEYDAKYNR
jgi:uncharacterized membrane protein YccC